jgi:hypothetical protein
VDDASLYKHIDSELPDPDRARQLIILCAARAPLPAPREGKDPPDQPSEKGMKLLQELKDDVLLLLAERKVDMNVMSTDQPDSAASGSVDVRTNEQNVNNRARTTRFKDEIRTYVFRCVQTRRFIDVCLIGRQGKGRGRRMGSGYTILQCLPRNSDEGIGTTTESEGQVSCPARGRLANIGIAEAITGGKRPGAQRLGKGCHGRA